MSVYKKCSRFSAVTFEPLPWESVIFCWNVFFWLMAFIVTPRDNRRWPCDQCCPLSAMIVSSLLFHLNFNDTMHNWLRLSCLIVLTLLHNVVYYIAEYALPFKRAVGPDSLYYKLWMWISQDVPQIRQSNACTVLILSHYDRSRISVCGLIRALQLACRWSPIARIAFICHKTEAGLPKGSSVFGRWWR